MRFRHIYSAVLAGVLLLAGAVSAKQTYDEVDVSVEAPPAENSTHGYAEFKILVTNNSPETTHSVTLVMPNRSWDSGDFIRRMSRTAVLAPNTSVSISMLQPPLSMNGDALAVEIDGMRQKETIGLNLANHCAQRSYYRRREDQVTLLLSRSINSDDFRNAAKEAFGNPSGGGYHPVDQWSIIKSESSVGEWAQSWLQYSRYDGIVLTAVEVRAMPAAVKLAVQEFVRCGGSLLVIGATDELERWQASRAGRNGDLTFYYMGFGLCAVANETSPAGWGKGTWDVLKTEAWNPTAAMATMINERDVADTNRWFPVIENLTIPVRGMFVLVLIFAVLIGPINLAVLSKKNRRIWMLWTVPVISVVASAAVFAYSTLAEGWKGYVRTGAITMLDERAHRATTIGVNAYYMPLTPRGGLHFDYQTEVTPLGISAYRGGRSRTIDWTADQHLDTGWVVARIPAHFLIRKSEMRRERIKASRSDAGTITIVNGLGADIKQMWLADETGKIHTAEQIAAGAKATMEATEFSCPIAGERPGLWREVFKTSWPISSHNILSSPRGYLRPNTYLVLLEDSLFIEQAIEGVHTKRYESVVYGIMEAAADGS